ncbi:Eco57I restriction-modification methylase domain-containing protein [Chloroflexota bacterium]
MVDLERQQSVDNLLQQFRGLEPLKQLFWSELNYQRVNQPLSRRDWTSATSTALVEDPILFASGGQDDAFHVIYTRLANAQLLLGQERPVISRLLRDHPYALFVCSNITQDHWHFINVKYDAETEKRRLFRRISVGPEERLRTAAERVAMLDLQSIQPDMFGLQPLTIQSRHDEAFDVEAVTKQFFEEYKAIFRILEDDLKRQANDHAWAHDYSLQFLNRCMFIYFIQRKGWLGNDRDFLMSLWKSYQSSGQSRDSFVDNWLRVLFFEAFNNKFHGGHKYFPPEIGEALSLAPYLNGGLFTESRLDQEHKAIVSDRRFEQIMKFLEGYNFTIAEDSPLDKEVAVDPEMIGKVYESLVNVSEEVDERGEAGIFYTPRTEIDLMCRLSLVDHLANHIGDERKELLNQLVFALEPDEKIEADQAFASATLWPALNERLHEITILDPACGSGSFLVGMLNILDDLQERADRQLGITEASYERKKRIIGQSLYGVDVMEWACHVAELRLWLALIIDAEFAQEELHVRQEPLLPHFSFKIRCGDSLVQEVGGINLGHVRESHAITPPLKYRITKLKNEKLKFYNNDKTCQFHSVESLKNEEKRLFSGILDARGHTIQDRINTLRRKLEGPQTYQIDLDGKGAPRPHQIDLEASKYRQEIEALTVELAQTEASKKALSAAREVPFVWDIAFVEIFEGENEGFDIVMGNPPYVRQEVIAAPIVHGVQVTDDKREYKAKLALSVYQAFPHFFGYKAGGKTPAHKINAKSDLYIYFYLHGLSLLSDKGSFCFITSNSWLDVGYGADLQEFLLKYCHVKLVLDNQVRRTFANADVNSIIVLFSPPDDRREWALEKTARFVMFRVPFEHILDPVIFDEIEEATERKATKEYRVFPIQQGKLLEDGCEILEEEETGTAAAPLIKSERYIGNKWGGKYLRAPDIYWTILEKGKGKLVRLGDIADVRRGFTTGANEFFYLDEERITEWGIESCFLERVVKGPKECKRIQVNPKEMSLRLFIRDFPYQL